MGSSNSPPDNPDPCGEIIPNTPVDLAVICENLHSSSGYYIDVACPDDPYISKDGLTQDKIDAFEDVYGDRFIRIYGNQPFTSASLTIAYHSVANGGDTGDSKAYYNLTWTSTSTQIIIELAGHIAVSGDPSVNPIAWGEGLGASFISGGPYHFKLEKLMELLLEHKITKSKEQIYTQ